MRLLYQNTTRNPHKALALHLAAAEVLTLALKGDKQAILDLQGPDEAQLSQSFQGWRTGIAKNLDKMLAFDEKKTVTESVTALEEVGELPEFQVGPAYDEPEPAVGYSDPT